MTVDPKLQHLINKILSLNHHQYNCKSKQDITTTTVHHVMKQLCTQHREYQRRSSDQLMKDISLAMNVYIQQQQHQQKRQIDDDDVNDEDIENVNNEQQQQYKRRSQKYNEDDDEEEYERAALNHDNLVSTATASVAYRSSLNDRLLQIGRNNSNNSNNKSSQQVQSNNSTSAIAARNDTTSATSTNDNENDMNNVDDRNSSTTGTTNKTTARKKKRRLVLRNKGNGDGNDNNEDMDGIQQSLSNSKVASFTIPVTRPTERYSDLGGLDTVIKTVQQLIEYPILRPEIYIHLGIDPPRGVLLRGPPGTGKTHLANAVAGQLGIPFFRVSAPELVAGVSGESESRIRSLFQAASDMAPSLIFIDEIDVIAPNRGSGSGDSGRGMEKRMVAQLLTSMDSLAPQNNNNQQAVLVLAATNRPDSLDPALRRPGRFDKEILLGVPDEDARIRILQTMTKGMRLQGIANHPATGTISSSPSIQSTMSTSCDNNEVLFDYRILARKTPGFVGADIRSLTKEAAVVAINRIFRDVLQDDSFHHNHESKNNSDQDEMKETLSITSNIVPLSAEKLDPLYVTMDDFLAAIPLVQPSSQREGFATIPDVSWDDIGALQSIREELTISVLEPIRSPEKFKALGLHLPAGVLLYGPPGCGKTLLAKAIAHESGANFISVKGPELLDKYVGESERAVRLVFERARCSSPCIIFFDELDSIVPRRGSDHGGGSGVTERVVNQLLTEMDGLESRRSVFIIAATNRPELIDPAMLRPGRLDKLLYVPLPTPTERVSILRTLAAKVTLGNDVDLDKIGNSAKAEGYSGADLSALLREAGLAVLKEHMTASASGMSTEHMQLCIHSSHFDAAFHAVLPSVSKKDHARYNKIRDRMARARSRGTDENEDENRKDEPIDDEDTMTLVPL